MTRTYHEHVKDMTRTLQGHNMTRTYHENDKDLTRTHSLRNDCHKIVVCLSKMFSEWKRRLRGPRELKAERVLPVHHVRMGEHTAGIGSPAILLIRFKLEYYRRARTDTMYRSSINQYTKTIPGHNSSLYHLLMH
jgi:hypothetical protein